MSGRLLKVLGITLVVPIIGFAVFSAVLGKWDAETATAGMPPLSYICAHAAMFEGEEGVCAERAPVALLRRLSVLGAVTPLVLVGLQLGFAAWAGRRRSAMAAVFPPLTRFTIWGLLAMVAMQTVVALGVLWFGESAFIGRVHLGLMLTLVAGAIAAGVGLAKAVLGMTRRPELFAVGRALTPDQAPRLFERVDALAARLGAASPNHIVVGFTPNFYVTHADVRVYDGPRLKGSTLYLSAPIARLLTEAELDAVIGHELGHFRGQDTAYSLKFAPVYAGLGAAVRNMIDGEGKVAWLAFPAIQMLGFLHDVFAANEAAVGRERELEADRAGVEAASSDALALALLKISLHGDAWEPAMHDARFVHAPEPNFSAAFAAGLSDHFDAARWRELLEPLLAQRTAHPIDTHPPVRERLEAMGFDLDGLDTARLLPAGQDATGAGTIDGLVDLERAVSDIEFDLRRRYGVLPAPLEHAQAAE